MRPLALLPVALATIAAGPLEPPPRYTPTAWTQERLDRLLIMADRRPGSATVTLTEGTELAGEQPADKIALPKAILAMAPTADAVDGILAMLIAYQKPVTSDGQRIDVPSTPTTNGLLTARGGNTADPDERERNRGLTIGGPAAPPENSPRARAWRGARWNVMAGNCEVNQIAFLRTAMQDGRVTVSGKEISWPGSAFARTVIRDLGSQAYPSEQRCRLRGDPDFEAVQRAVRTDPPLP